jgi:hypothetical protein
MTRRTPLKSRKPLRRRKGLARVSAKRKVQDAKYARLRKKFLAEHPLCQVALDHNNAVQMGGGGVLPMKRAELPRSTQVHHMAGRGAYLLRVDTWLAVSDEGHREITENPTWAFANGYRLTREQIRLLP